MSQAMDQFEQVAKENSLTQKKAVEQRKFYAIPVRPPMERAVEQREFNAMPVMPSKYGIGFNQQQEWVTGRNRQEKNDKVTHIIKNKLLGDIYLHQLLMAEYKLPTTNHCEVLVHLVRECNLTLEACLDVAMTNDDIETAKRLLTQECPICWEQYIRNEMVSMVHCDHAVCKDCFIGHFNIMIGEKSIKYFNCMLCAEPDMSSETIDMDLYLQLFSGLVQAHLSIEIYDMFTRKVNEQAMTKKDNFRWCIKCCTGFINEDGRKIVQCPNVECGQQMCFHCKKPWEQAHNGLSCEQFAQWKIDNDPELQAQGLAAYLNEEGIECPSCKFKYALAKGGCMHFRCTQCPAEFCSGCGGLFKQDCVKYESCRARGLHAHHPRDCLFYLCDESVDDLQKLLNDNNVQFDTEPPKGQAMDTTQASTSGEVQLECSVMLCRENRAGALIDEECGKPVQSGHAGLCEKHYKEYLVYKINQNHIDPLPLWREPGLLQRLLRRDEKRVPDQQAGETEEQYCERLRQVIKEELPLQRIKRLNKGKFIY
ncbi:E3 ubiquitin-protein ligase RNF31-like [Dysidea avara]|uniref:E3 ubiquitin-protein ligase RNF31-like n=1 Tax=Dysidea avara TaxID=196820 RepID=UPI003321A59E